MRTDTRARSSSTSAEVQGHPPSSAVGGVRHCMLVVATMWSRKALQSLMLVLTATLFSHSNSAHMFLRRAQGGGRVSYHW